MTRAIAHAPGRVNLIGDHTDYTGGLVLPMAIDRVTTVTLDLGGDRVVLRSDHEVEPADVGIVVSDPAIVDPPWARYVAGVVAEVRPSRGGVGTVSSTVPIGAGMSSSAALEVAVALALGFEGTALDLALACQRAEQRAAGVPCGVMDQLASAAGVADHALLIDCTALTVRPVPIPREVDVVVVPSGEERALANSAYADRRSDCEAAAALIGPLADARLEDVDAIADDRLRRRARHVVTENRRVVAFADALQSGAFDDAGRLMLESHRSLAADFDVSTQRLDALVAELSTVDGVYGARLTGAGFGGCVVALVRRGTTVEGVRVRASNGATVQSTER